ncbi:hypothetical protein AVEN_191057-1 [Araneus ventricosus]|uniref:Uncharacterized protein n=1 Tax=Araneus ventricosus TaxID=182803 RepID=A0A4Y2AYE9_ARAVE|nr:hypothetical protein AVEN_191057-1 [Araneus ventricosus]
MAIPGHGANPSEGSTHYHLQRESLNHYNTHVQEQVLSYRHEKNPRHQTCLWRSLWKRDIPLYFGVKERALFQLAQIGPVEFSFCLVLRVKTNSSHNGSALRLPNVAVNFISLSLLSSTRLFEATLLRVFFPGGRTVSAYLYGGFSSMDSWCPLVGLRTPI